VTDCIAAGKPRGAPATNDLQYLAFIVGVVSVLVYLWLIAAGAR
jgi:hypothetical protein